MRTALVMIVFALVVISSFAAVGAESAQFILFLIQKGMTAIFDFLIS